MRAKGPSASRRRSPKRQGVWGPLKVSSGVQGQSPGGGPEGEAPGKSCDFAILKAISINLKGTNYATFMQPKQVKTIVQKKDYR